MVPRGLARPLHGADGGRSGDRGRDGGGAAAATEADGPEGGIHLCARIPGLLEVALVKDAWKHLRDNDSSG